MLLNIVRIMLVAAALARPGIVTAQSLPTVGDGCLHVLFMDVGQGDASLVIAPDGATLLIDGGGSPDKGAADPGRLVIAKVLEALKIRALDLVLMTHPHPDHIRGLFYIAENWPIKQLLHGGTRQDPQDGTGEVERLIGLVEQAGGEVALAQNLAGGLVWHGLTLQVLHPLSADGGPYIDFELNDNSVVMRLVHGQRSILFAGDIEHAAEAILHAKLGSTDLLKVAHHGNQNSSTQLFLDRVKPKDAIISSGANNPYGVPHAATLKRLDANGATVWRTSKVGHVHLRSCGDTWRIGPVPQGALTQ